MSFQGRTAIVTGGAVRLGKALALSLAANGFRICLHYSHSRDEAFATRDQIAGLGIDVDLIDADFRQPVTAAGRVMGFAHDRFGSVDVLVNSAAIFEPGTHQDTSESNWDRHMNINLKAPFFLSQEFAKLEKSRSHSASSRCIVNIADWRGTIPVPGHFAYTISKGALITLTRILAQELGPAIRVNAIAPGAILPGSGSDQRTFDLRAQCNPLQHTGHPEDVCEAMLYLLRSEFVTGEILHVTGGEQLQPGKRYDDS